MSTYLAYSRLVYIRLLEGVNKTKFGVDTPNSYRDSI